MTSAPAIALRAAANDARMAAPVGRFCVQINYPGGRLDTWDGIYPSLRAAENDAHARVDSIPFAILVRRLS